MTTRSIVWIIGGIFAAIVLCLGGCAVGMYVLIDQVVCQSEPVQLVLKRIESVEGVAEAIGPGPYACRVLSGSISIEDGLRGKAAMDTYAHGRKGSLKLVAELHKERGDWLIDYLAVYPQGVKVVVPLTAEQPAQPAP